MLCYEYKENLEIRKKMLEIEILLFHLYETCCEIYDIWTLVFKSQTKVSMYAILANFNCRRKLLNMFALSLKKFENCKWKISSSMVSQPKWSLDLQKSNDHILQLQNPNIHLL